MIDNTIIAVFCYKRAAKLKASMEALLKNPECASMDVIFFCDGPKGEHDKKGVEDTRAYINSLTGFRNVYKHFREKNISTGPNFQKGLTHLYQNFEQFIVIEDDLVVSPNYITYMLQALEHYRKSSNVFCVTGFCFPLKKKDYVFDTTIHNRFCSYGWASWAERVNKVTWDPNELYRMTKTSPDFKSRLNSEGWDLYRMLMKQLDGTISTWDIQMQVHVSENRMKVVYPVVSKATNIGFDQESTNTFGVDYLKTPLDDGSQRVFNFCPVDQVDLSLRKQLKKPYGLKALATRKMINTVIKLTS
jgi:hypothetical protein